MTSVYQRSYTQRDGSVFQEYERFHIEYRDASHSYWLHYDNTRQRVVSVTTALKVLDKGGALLKWAEAAGAEGAVILERRGHLKGVEPSQVVEQVRINAMGMEAKRDAGANRGTAVHEVLELWAREARVPELEDFPAEVRGYVQGLCRFLIAHRPKPTSVERLVGSPVFKYAGRMDLRADIDGRDCIVDLKTNPHGRVYDEAHLQARAYAIADVECGNPDPEGIVIVAVGEDGGFEMVECEAEAGDWLHVLRASNSMKRLGAARRARLKAVA